MESPNTSRQAFELNPSCSGQAHPNRPGLVLSMKTWSLMHSHNTPHFIYGLSTQKRGCNVGQGCLKDSPQLAQMGVLVSLGEHLRAHLKDHTSYDRGPEIHGKQGECHSKLAKLSWLDP